MTRQNKQRTRTVLNVCFIIYLIVLFYFLFFSERYGRTTVRNSEYQYNLELFKEIKRYLVYRGSFTFELFFLNIIGNVVAFIPYGFLVPVRKRLHGFSGCILVTLFTFQLSLFIESVQLVSKVGSFDVDDILLNTIGGFLGYILYVIGYAIFIRRTKEHGVSKKKR